MRVRTSGFQQYDLRPSRFDATQKFLSALLWINFHIAILQFYGIFFFSFGFVPAGLFKEKTHYFRSPLEQDFIRFLAAQCTPVFWVFGAFQNFAKHTFKKNNIADTYSLLPGKFSPDS